MSTVLKNLSGLPLLTVLVGVLAGLTVPARAQELNVPHSVIAGEGASVSSHGNGKATFYLVGPGVSQKREISLGDEIRIAPTDLEHAGRYLAILCAGDCRSAEFSVIAAEPSTVAFLVHPSRVPVHQADAISGVALLFDHFSNLVLTSTPVNFVVKSPKENLFSKPITTQNGEAWFRTSSGKAAGPVTLTASADRLSAQRVVQQVASEPCNLRIKAAETPHGIEVQTEPVRDCAGNPVSDGTIISFTGADSAGRISIDAPIKGGIARARMAVPEPVVISAASGVTIGNELRIGKKP